MEYELRLQDGTRVIWEGESGEEACSSYLAHNPQSIVVAWRQLRRHGLFFPRPEMIVEPGDWRWGK